MKVEFLDPAKEELAEAIAYYNNESEGLGYRFAAEARRTMSRIIQYPRAWPTLSERTRRCRTIGFPYGIVYQIREDVILVVGVMHLHRDPEYWKSRLPRA
jgi:hypothetical protein